MPSAYLAISYKCNQHCSFCPCSKEEAKYPYVEFSELKQTIDTFIREQNIDTIVISGGEPTIHPDFMKVINYTSKQSGLHTVILSNGERYADPDFIKQIQENADISKITAITTIHSHIPEEHEGINGSKGSFERSTQGLRNMCGIGADVIIKHCITKVNYRDLDLFYSFVNQNFSSDVSVQLCSIDYCGIDEGDMEKHMLSFVELQPYLEKMFDLYMEEKEKGECCYLYAINMPYCACDPYYWDILTPRSDTYKGYASPDDSGRAHKSENVESNVAPAADACRECAAVEMCPGTYRTAFRYFGDKIIKPY